MIEVVIDTEAEGQRLDRFLRKHLANASLSFIYKSLRNGSIKVNKKKAKPELHLKKGDMINIFFSAERYEQSRKKDEKITIKKTFDVLYEDDDILIANKPPMLASQPGTGVEQQNLINQVKSYLNNNNAALANRLDRGTSGIVTIGKNRKAILALFNLYKEHKVEKYYLAMVKGHLSKKSGTLHAHLKRTTERFQHKMLVLKQKEEGAVTAETSYKVLQESPSYSLLALQIKTGKMHQIRVQFTDLGYPLLGDRIYGDKELNKRYATTLRRQFLHAYKIRFIHPFTNKQIDVIAPLPEDLKKILLKNFTPKPDWLFLKG